MKKKILFAFLAVGVSLSLVPLLSAFEAHVINVTATIENKIFLDPIPDIDFGTTFPQEKLDRTFDVSLASTFMNDPKLDDLEYMLRQKPKCVDAFGDHPPVGEDDNGNFICPQGSTMMPLLCPYLSKEEITADGKEQENDGPRIPPFHGLPGIWKLGTTIAYATVGRLIKSAEDITDRWNIDLKVPCFRGECAQDWPKFVSTYSASTTINANDYKANPALKGKTFGCDLWIEVTATSSSHEDCTKQLDLMLVLDRSGSIDSSELATLKNAANDFVDALAPSNDGVHVGQSSFASTGSLDLHLTGDATSSHAAINALVAGGFTNLKQGIELATGEMDNTHIHERPSVKDVMVIITDGEPNRPFPVSLATSSAAIATDAARTAGIEVFVVGVGVSSSTEAYLKTDIADDASHYFSASNFAALQTALQSLPLCQAL